MKYKSENKNLQSKNKLNNNGFVATGVLYSLIGILALILFMTISNLATIKKNTTDTMTDIKNELAYYEVIYHANSGSGLMANSYFSSGETNKLKPNTFTKIGYHFNGWGLTSTSTTDLYSDQSLVNNQGSIEEGVRYLPVKTRGSITLYATWKASNYEITFDANGGSVSQNSKKVTYNSSYGTLPTPEYEGYIFEGWYTKKVKGDKITADTTVSTGKNHTLYAHWKNATVSDILFVSENLGENCATYDDGVDTFLVGKCSQNYVWYSGKLWRVVLKNNSTGVVKMVTDGAITTIAYNASGNSTFENSYMDQWLSQEFLPTLHDYQDYLVTNSIWNATTDGSSAPVRPAGTTTVERTVGLLNVYEYYMTYAQSGGLATSSTTYLKNGVYWWLITPTDASSVQRVDNYGSLSDSGPVSTRGARPSVNLKSTIQIGSGSGSKSDPYILKGDQQETVAGTTLLSTRYSGEYITFNNELYRIVGVENGLTKITAVDKPSSLASNKFHSAEGVTSFANADIKTNLETYYQDLKTTNEEAFNMIEPNTTWYLGGAGPGDSFGNHHYKASICASVDASVSMNACTEKATSTTANIGLPRAGEMFTSLITRGTKASFFTLTPYSEYRVRYVGSDGILYHDPPMFGKGACRLSMYLKADVKIASGNTGNGTYEKPYTLSQ